MDQDDSRTDPFTAVVVLSGGLDSTTLMAHYAALQYRLIAVTVDYGQRHHREIDAARAVAAHFGAEHHVVDLRGYGALLRGSALTDDRVSVPDGHYAEQSMRATVVPNRNAVLANVAVSIGVAHRASVVALGMHAGDHFIYPDCRPEFVAALRELVATANEGFAVPQVEAPFLSWAKTDIATHGVRLGAPLELSWSCYKGGDRHCGTCGTCYERREAFRNAGLADPTGYLDDVTAYPAP
ncbi:MULTISPECIES: 7-cyano-7-deazaguanine synthase QueC [Streptomyces]|uniref:7-cyano-7-deazaguanine synthase n=2 Tax=Streptomyces TaxID=1883 RepID=A0A1L7B5M4_STRDA|nr:7-cyano-7-deazaguanine synthase QueC [Streptomyces noursei]AFV92622.1 TymM [Streptomyces ahygroscopicus subsp. wuzhouensis]APT68169.1 ToyM [Streptomyces diastatochromogenes]MCE4942277.1 7-cyano-7-deazaguanine synthase QueC [Streptomyces noursei]